MDLLREAAQDVLDVEGAQGALPSPARTAATTVATPMAAGRRNCRSRRDDRGDTGGRYRCGASPPSPDPVQHKIEMVVLRSFLEASNQK